MFGSSILANKCYSRFPLNEPISLLFVFIVLFVSHRNCGIEDPSWAELRHFVNFLNSQLQSCEESSFCNMELVGDTLEGFRSFVVRFMILMSRVIVINKTSNDRSVSWLGVCWLADPRAGPSISSSPRLMLSLTMTGKHRN